jgi:hypothetical protein
MLKDCIRNAAIYTSFIFTTLTKIGLTIEYSSTISKVLYTFEYLAHHIRLTRSQRSIRGKCAYRELQLACTTSGNHQTKREVFHRNCTKYVDNLIEGITEMHFVSLTCTGEKCSMCGNDATHKVAKKFQTTNRTS